MLPATIEPCLILRCPLEAAGGELVDERGKGEWLEVWSHDW